MGQEEGVRSFIVADDHEGAPRSRSPEEPFLLGNHPRIKAVLDMVDAVADSPVPVLVTGESGTGKEIVAQLLHQRSSRQSRSLVALNCAALPRDVIENELFGHEREAYTGAVTSRPGAFEIANGSTLFLDEIGEMHQQVQAKLLRAIELKCFRRLGGHEDINVDVRVVAATNRDIQESLATGALREDLYYRLSVVEVCLPPLRERPGDIGLLADYFALLFSEKYQKPLRTLSRETREILEAYPWPGNVRELKNVLESVVLISANEEIQPSDIPARISSRPAERSEVCLPLGLTLEEAERIYVLRALANLDGNKSAAARVLGLSRKSLYDRLLRYTQGPGPEADGEYNRQGTPE